MTRDWRIADKAAREHAEERAEEYAQAQRQAFLDGYEAAMVESETMAGLREWLETQRDTATEQYQETDDDRHLIRRLAFISVLTKLSEMGFRSEDDDL